jgi:hypothetical protein
MQLHRAARILAAVGLVLVAIAGPLTPRAAAADGEIVSAGPLTRIFVTPDLNCQVNHESDASAEFYGGEIGACGTFVAIDGSGAAPAQTPPAGLVGTVAWTPVSQSAVTGSGRAGDPFTLTTVVEAAELGIRVEQVDSYLIGEQSYRTDVRVSNTDAIERQATVYRAGDCYLQDSDVGYGRVDDGAPACVISLASDARIEQWVAITPGSRYYEGTFSLMWQTIRADEPFPNTCLCDQALDNGAGLSWEITVPAGGSVEVSHSTFFSPTGRQSTTPLRDSVPGPADVTLDPIVLATSAAISAGVVALVPFPAALFNSTLEEHYSEVMGWVGHLREWGAALASMIVGLVRRGVRRTRQQPAGQEGAPAERGAAFALDEAFWRSPVGIGAFIAASALLYGLLDPTFGLNADSLATFIGLTLGMLVVLAAFGIPLAIGARGQGLRVGIQALPFTVVVALGCVVLSRVADFQPGYLYGMILGFTFSRALTKAETGKLEVAATAVALAAAVGAWLLLPVVRADASGVQPFGAAVVETACATVVVAGLEAASFAMIPLRFLPGERVRAWNRRAWAVLLGLATFGFCHILLNPSSGYLADTTRTSLFTVVWLLVGFASISVLFWAYFRFRPGHQADPTPPPPAPFGQ